MWCVFKKLGGDWRGSGCRFFGATGKRYKAVNSCVCMCVYRDGRRYGNGTGDTTKKNSGSHLTSCRQQGMHAVNFAPTKSSSC